MAPKNKSFLRLTQICFEGYTTDLAFKGATVLTKATSRPESLLLVWGKSKSIKPKVNKKCYFTISGQSRSPWGLGHIQPSLGSTMEGKSMEAHCNCHN